jgi:predicted amidohydrolase
MARMVRVSTVQLDAVVPGETFSQRQRRNRLLITRALMVAGERKSDLVLFGEYANLHHRSCSRAKKDYVFDPIPGSFTRMVSRYAHAHRMNVAMPMLGTWQGVPGNFVVLIDRKGMVVGCYQKTHPTESEQRKGIVPGNELPVFALDCCTVGIMTCMDIEYPEVAQVLMLHGAEMLLFPHVQTGWSEADWEVRYRARAIDTGLCLVSACYGYPEGAWSPGKLIGRSGVVGRDGLITGDLGRSIGILTHDIDLDEKRVTQFFFDTRHDRTTAVQASRRPELYRDLTVEEFRTQALMSIRKHRKKRHNG